MLYVGMIKNVCLYILCVQCCINRFVHFNKSEWLSQNLVAYDVAGALCTYNLPDDFIQY